MELIILFLWQVPQILLTLTGIAICTAVLGLLLLALITNLALKG